LSPVQRLILSAFRFNVVKSKEIFLHCLVKACLRSDQSSRCVKGCPFGKRKKRESENEIERFLALGPIIVSSNRPSEITGMASVVILALEWMQSFKLTLRSSPDAILEAHGLADRHCALVCALRPDLQAKGSLLAVYSCNCTKFVFTLIFLVCLSHYLAESLKPKEDTTVVGVVAGLLGFVAVLLVAALVAVIYKRRKKPDVPGAVTLPLVRGNVPGPG